MQRHNDPCHHELQAHLGAAVARHCPPSLSAERDDIHQTASMSVAMRMRQRPDLSPTKAYLRRVAVNAVIDAVRSRGSRQRWHHQVARLPRELPRTPEEELAAAELGQALREHIDRLPQARRDAVVMYVRGHGPSEIAQHFGCGTKRVENLLYRGLRTLRASLTHAGYGPGVAA